MVRDVNREPLTNVYALVRFVYVIESKPLASIGDAYCYLGKSSQIVMMRRNAYLLA
jgi:hypothetical protein